MSSFSGYALMECDLVREANDERKQPMRLFCRRFLHALLEQRQHRHKEEEGKANIEKGST